MKFTFLTSTLAVLIVIFSSLPAFCTLEATDSWHMPLMQTDPADGFEVIPFDSLQNNQEKHSPVRIIKNDVISAADAAIYTFIAPVRWKGKDWLKFGGVISGVGLSSLADTRARSFWIGEDSKSWDQVKDIGFYYGAPETAMILTGGFYLTGLAAKNEWLRETGLILGTTFITTATMRTALKPLFGRARPYAEEGNYTFRPFSNSVDFHSLPSGHMIFATSVSFVLAKRINNPFAKAGFYALAGTTLASRMYSDTHWFSDMVLGGAISWFASEAVINRFEARKLRNGHANRKINWEAQPFPGGLVVTGRF